MFILAKCQKCDNYGVLDVGDYSDKEVEAFLEKRDFGECPFNGWHVEVGSMANYISVNYSKKFESRNKAKEEAKRMNSLVK